MSNSFLYGVYPIAGLEHRLTNQRNNELHTYFLLTIPSLLRLFIISFAAGEVGALAA